MKIKVVFVFSLLIKLNPSLAQINAVQALDSVFISALNIKKGNYTVYMTQKNLTDSDSIFANANTFFFRDLKVQSKFSFISYLSTGTILAYDGDSTLYSIYTPEKKASVYNVANNQQIEKTLNKSTYNKIVFLPYLTGGYSYKSYKDEIRKSEIYCADKNESIYNIIGAAKYKNQLSQKEDEPDSILFKFNFTVNNRKHYLINIRNWYIYPEMLQYLSLDISPIRKLHENETFSSILQIDSFYKNGYKFIYINKENIKNKLYNNNLTKGDTIPKFILYDYINKKNVRYYELNNKIALIDFCYISCAPCIQSIPMLNRLNTKFKDKGLDVFGVDIYNNDTLNIKTHLKRFNINYPIYFSLERNIANNINIEYYPTLLIIDLESRKIIFSKSGYDKESEHEIVQILNYYLKK
jgi:thiol-disulfide isomerase/thioredoxin